MDRETVSVALEQRYVHDVYSRIAPHCCRTHHKAWPRVRQFLEDLRPGSLVADIGCGNGRYLDINKSAAYILGSDRCSKFAELAGEKGHETMVCDNLRVPYRDSSFDAVISIGVIHHFTTTERRVEAIRELARILRVGGRLMICVWAMEQTRRNFDAQDVLVPWNKDTKRQRKRARSKTRRLQHASSSSLSEDENLSDAVSLDSEPAARRNGDSKKQTHKNTIRNLFEKIADLVEKAQSVDGDTSSPVLKASSPPPPSPTESHERIRQQTLENKTNAPYSPIRYSPQKSPVLPPMLSDATADSVPRRVRKTSRDYDEKRNNSLPDVFRGGNIFNFISSKFTNRKSTSEENVVVVDKDNAYRNLINHIIEKEPHIFEANNLSSYRDLSREGDGIGGGIEEFDFQVREFPQSSRPRRQLLSDSALQTTDASNGYHRADSIHSKRRSHSDRVYATTTNGASSVSVEDFSSFSITDDDSDSLFSNSRLGFGEFSTEPSQQQPMIKPTSLNITPYDDNVPMAAVSEQNGHRCNNNNDRSEESRFSSSKSSHLSLPSHSSRLGSDEFSSSSSDVHSGSTPSSQNEDLKNAFVVSNLATTESSRPAIAKSPDVGKRRQSRELNAADGIKSPTYHRYYHVFRDGELPKLIERHVPGLAVVQAYYDHANWCVIAEKIVV
ncbi:uncharacterized protein LOC141906298 [Tubulanus polymorphus]|uniref:uncharacterized protein LOC141906298 n=1 Tax=Tubulanus polymorphus TaxID=672921 RepID=UPI003DA6301C